MKEGDFRNPVHTWDMRPAPLVIVVVNHNATELGTQQAFY